MPKPTFRIDGTRFADLQGFYTEIERQLLHGTHWGRNLDALNDIMRGEFGPLPREFRFEWSNSELSKQRLGTGKGSFTELIEIIGGHPNVELVLS